VKTQRVIGYCKTGDTGGVDSLGTKKKKDTKKKI